MYRYRAARGNSGVNPNLGGITAVARAERRRPDRYGPVPLGAADPGQRLLPRSPRGSGSCWAPSSTRTTTSPSASGPRPGTTVGSFPGGGRGPAATDVLELIVRAAADPDEPHLPPRDAAVYRVAGADLDRVHRSQVGITLNRSERPVSGRRGDVSPAARPRRAERSPRSSTGRTGSFPGPRTPRPRPGGGRPRTSSFPTSSRSPTRPG